MEARNLEDQIEQFRQAALRLINTTHEDNEKWSKIYTYAAKHLECFDFLETAVQDSEEIKKELRSLGLAKLLSKEFFVEYIPLASAHANRTREMHEKIATTDAKELMALIKETMKNTFQFEINSLIIKFSDIDEIEKNKLLASAEAEYKMQCIMIDSLSINITHFIEILAPSETVLRQTMDSPIRMIELRIVEACVEKHRLHAEQLRQLKECEEKLSSIVSKDFAKMGIPAALFFNPYRTDTALKEEETHKHNFNI